MRLRNKTVIDGWDSSGVREGSFEMKAGVPVGLELDYFQDGGKSELRILWRLPDKVQWIQVPAHAFHFSAADQSRINSRFRELMAAYEHSIMAVPNPRPRDWPELEFLLQGRYTQLRATFPDVPGLTFDAWMYESELELLGVQPPGQGRLDVRHRFRAYPPLTLISQVLPEKDAIEIQARIETPPGDVASLPLEVDAPNLCWQLSRSPLFHHLPEFSVQRVESNLVVSLVGIGEENAAAIRRPAWGSRIAIQRSRDIPREVAVTIHRIE